MTIADLRDQLLSQLKTYTPPPQIPLSTNDPYLLVSCLQKGLRRADARTVMGTAASLLAVDPARFWKRLSVVAFEDFGQADTNLTGAIVAAASHKLWRANASGDWVVASFLLGKLLSRPRDRFLDDLYTLAFALDTKPAVRAEWKKGKVHVSDGLWGLMSIATHLVATCEAPIPHKNWRAPLAYASDQTLRDYRAEGMIGDDLLDICLQGRRTSGCLLPVLLPLMIRAAPVGDTGLKIARPELPPVRMVGDIPGYVFDGYTRPGRQALEELLEAHRHLGRLWQETVGHRERISGMQSLLFNVEGGLATEHLTSPIFEEMRGYSSGCWSGLTGSARLEGLEMMREAIPFLNAIRAEMRHGANGVGGKPSHGDRCHG